MKKAWESILLLEEDFKLFPSELEKHDIFLISFDSPYIIEGSIPLLDLFDRVKYIKDLISYSACSEITKRANFRRPFDDAALLLEKSKFAQTEVGSFVINILIPQGKTYVEPKEIEDKGYLTDLGSKSLTRLIDGIEDIKGIEAKIESDFKSSYDLKLNKNVCEAIKELMGSEKGSR